MAVEDKHISYRIYLVAFAIFLMAIPALTLHAGAQTQGSLPTLGDTSDLTVSAERRLGDRN